METRVARTDSGGTTVAVLADIHGNAVTLAAMLAECAAEGIDRFVLPGDLAWGPQPREVVEWAVSLGDRATVVRGNADREVSDPTADDVPPDLVASTAWCAAQLTPAQRAWLGALPPTGTISVDGVGPVLVCHGTPASDTGHLRPDLDAAAAEAALAGIREPTVLCGHSHVRFDAVVGGHRVVNPGSVGLHSGSTEALWATVGPDGIRLRSTAYDRERAASLAERSGMPGAEDFAAFFRDPAG